MLIKKALNPLKPYVHRMLILRLHHFYQLSQQN